VWVPVWALTTQPKSEAPAVAEIGKLAPAFTLTSPQGKSFSLASDRSAKKVTLLMFISAECPVSNAYNERMVKLAQDYTPKGVRVLGINANGTESVEEIAKHAKAHGFPFPVLIDVGNVVADRYDAQVTPHTYVIDGSGILRYRGRIDDKQSGGPPTAQDLRNALDAVLAGKTVPVTDTRAFGCGIKRMEKE
jgi:peroxiredoxin